MKNFYFLLLTLFISIGSFGQTILLLEDFSGTPQYTLPPDMPEQIVSTTDYFTRTDGTNIASPINFTDGKSYFAAQDIDTDPMVSPATMLFDNVDISTFTDLTFGVGLAEHDAGNGDEDWDSTDFVHFEYQIDNSGIWKNLVWVENDGSTFNSAPQIDTDFDGVGDGVVLTNVFDEDVLFTFSETGSLIDIRVTFGGLTSDDEDIAIDIIYLVDSISLFNSVTITSPTQGQVFPAGTTSVDVAYTITNTPERVDIIVNDALTSDIGNVSGSFPVSTSDGESYLVDLIVTFDGGEVARDFIEFSVDSSLGIDENEDENFSVYPNPTSLGFVNIASKNNETITARVFDVLGKQVINTTVTDNRLNVSNLNPGLYFIKLIQNNARVAKKLVIK